MKNKYRNALITATPRVNRVHDFDLKYLYDYSGLMRSTEIRLCNRI